MYVYHNIFTKYISLNNARIKQTTRIKTKFKTISKFSSLYNCEIQDGGYNESPVALLSAIMKEIH